MVSIRVKVRTCTHTCCSYRVFINSLWTFVRHFYFHMAFNYMVCLHLNTLNNINACVYYRVYSQWHEPERKRNGSREREKHTTLQTNDLCVCVCVCIAYILIEICRFFFSPTLSLSLSLFIKSNVFNICSMHVKEEKKT